MEWLSNAVIHGKYRVGRRLGEGGMGAVYLAEHVGIGRQVALKVVRPALLADPTATERFVREARAAGGIQHRHVVNVTDFGVDHVDGHEVAYLVMEQLHGQTLQEVLEARQRLPLRLVVDIVAQVADALGAAHARGVVHRDLKPANIWLTPDARGGFHVTLLDFGIAKLRDDRFARPRAPSAPIQATSHSGADGDGALAASTATQAGESIGTPAYMSPEQCVGDDVDARSDVYSLGIVVYQLLAGALPFRGNAVELLRHHFVSDVPALPADAQLSPNVEAVVQRALAKNPADRFQSALSFASALRAHAMGFGESMRRALGVFAERMPELATLGVCFALPGVLATMVGTLAGTVLPVYLLPLLWIGLLNAAMLVSAPLAIASIASIFGTLRERPFTSIHWRSTAQLVAGRDGGAPVLYGAWLRAAVSRYVRTARSTKGGGVRTMLHFVDQFRRGGERSTPERLEMMATVLPTKAFATMAVAQFGVLLLAPVLAMLAAFGVVRIVDLSGSVAAPLVAVIGGMAFTAALFLQVFIALVDVMLYDLAYDMTRD